MTLWQDIIAAALLGTERQAAQLQEPAGALGSLLDKIGNSAAQDREGALLGTAASVALYGRAGREPVTASGAMPDKAPPETRKRCSRSAARHLAMMLAGTYREALPEWLAAVESAGLRVPENLLPALLTLGGRDSALRLAIIRVAGQRGGWLARQEGAEAWAYAAARDEQSTWETGNQTARALLIEQMHVAEPERARALLSETWKDERAEDRVSFLKALQPSLVPADEAFLENVLDDRSKQVRAAAADLLARIPGSALCGRMEQRATALVALKSGKKPRLTVTLPDTCDATMMHDGINDTVPYSMGERAWWLTQILAYVPPAVWCAAWGKTPAEIVTLAAKNDMNEVLFGGWGRAAVRNGAADWAEALLQEEIRENLKTDLVDELVMCLPAARREALAVKTLGTESLYHDIAAIPILQACRHPWSLELTIVVLESFYRRLGESTTSTDHYMPGVLLRFALYMAPGVITQLGGTLPATPEVRTYWKQTIDLLMALLQFRLEMLKELA